MKLKSPTAAQVKTLKSMDPELFRFINPVRSCEALESLGLAESRLQVKSKNFATGMTQVGCAYRITSKGIEFLKSVEQ